MKQNADKQTMTETETSLKAPNYLISSSKREPSYMLSSVWTLNSEDIKLVLRNFSPNTKSVVTNNNSSRQTLTLIS